ncbi:hypothetical protein ABDJ41_20245 [Pedobacter sp. ASV1-7]|uniref:hypothetical protein n=1 Tax=Pedobacter sp. ASV1-7 TaxID=3145237 RepID=UPI0032E91917
MKLFVNIFGPGGQLNMTSTYEVSDFLIYSLMISIINLNININGAKTILERLCRGTLNVIIVLDCILLTLTYLTIKVNHMEVFFILAIGFPIITGMFFKFKYQPIEE